MPYRFGGGSISCSIPVHAPISRTFKNDAGIVVDPDDPDNPKPFEPFPAAEASISISYGPASVSISPHYEIIPTVTTFPSPDMQPRIYKVGWEIGVSILGASDTQIIILDEKTLQPGEKKTLAGILETSFSMSVAVDNCFEETFAGLLDTIDAPFRGGGRIFQRLMMGATGSVSCGPASASGTVTNANEVASQLAFSANAHCVNGGGGGWSIEPPDGFYTPVDPVLSGSANDANGSATVSAWSLTCAATETKVCYASVSASARRPKTYHLSGVVRAQTEPYPDALTGTCVRFLGDAGAATDMPIAGGAFSSDYSQRQGGIIGGYQGASSVTLADFSINEFSPIGCSIKASSQSGVGDDERATRILLKGRTFGAMSLTKSDVTVDAGTSLSPVGAWAGAWEAVAGGAAPSIVGGGVSFLGSARRAFTHDVSFSGSRHLRLTLKASVANAPFALATGGKSWNAKAGADTSQFAQVDIDLAAEVGAGTTSTHDTKWPLQRDDDLTGDDLPLSEGAYFGVQRVSHLTLTGAAGTTFVVSKIELVTTGTVTCDAVPTFYHGKIIYQNGVPVGIDESWPVEQYPARAFGTGGEGVSTYFARRGLLVNCDGVQMEQEDSTYIYSSPPSGNSSLSASQLSILDLVNNINRVNANGTILNPGYEAVSSKPYPLTGCAVDLPDFDACYMNEARPAAWLFGAGAMASADDWQFGWDRELSEIGTAQQGFDVFDWYPEADDWAGFGGSTPAPMTQYLRAAAILRGAIHGLTLTSGKQPAPDKLVELRQGTPAPGDVVSTGTSGANGFYKTNELPFAKTVQAGAVKSGGRMAGGTFYGRKRHRYVFVLAALGKWLTGDASMAGRLVRGSSADNYLMLEFANDITAQDWGGIATILTAHRPCVRYSRLSGALYVSFQTAESGGAIAAAWTTTEGRTWDGMATINDSGEFPTFCILQSGLQCHFWRTDGGVIQSKIVSPALAQVYPPGGAVLTVVPSGVAEDALTAWVELATGYIFLSYRNDEGQVVTVRSVNGGKSYS